METANKYIYVGTYTQKMGHILGDQLSKGIHTFKFNEDGSLTEVGEAVQLENPTFLTTSPNGKFLYATSEIGMHYIPEQTYPDGGTVTSYSIDQDSGKLTLLNKVLSGGDYAAHVSINSAGTRVVCANYIGKTCAIFDVKEDGSLSECVSKVSFDQEEGKRNNEGAHSQIKCGPDEGR